MTTPLFRRLLGQDMERLPPILRQAHDADDRRLWVGTAVVTRSANPIARLLCRMMKLPSPGDDVPVTILFERTGTAERWSRTFAGRRYRSSLAERNGALIPRNLRDPIYRWVARNRYRIFGKRESCWIPHPKDADRLS